MTGKQEQAVLAVVRLIGDQDVEVTAQHASSTSAAITVRIGRALLYLNDEANGPVHTLVSGHDPHPFTPREGAGRLRPQSRSVAAARAPRRPSHSRVRSRCP